MSQKKTLSIIKHENVIKEKEIELLPNTPYIFKIENVTYTDDIMDELLRDPYSFVINNIRDNQMVDHIIKFFNMEEEYFNENKMKELQKKFMARLNNMMNDPIYASVMVMMVNEFFLPDNVGGIYKNLYNLLFVILLCTKRLTDKRFWKYEMESLDETTMTIVNGVFKLIKDNILFFDMFVRSAYYDDNKHVGNTNFVDTILDDLDKRPIIYPFTIPGHQMSYVFRKNKPKNLNSKGLDDTLPKSKLSPNSKGLGDTYIVSFMNSGQGINYHPQIILGTKYYVKGIVEYTLDRSIMSLFLLSISINSRHNDPSEYYGSIIYLLETRSLSVNRDSKGAMINESVNYDKYYIEPQTTGNCVARAFLIPLYMYSNIMCTDYNRLHNDLLFLIRLIIVSTHRILFDQSISDNSSYIMGVYNYQSFQKYINTTNVTKVPHIKKIYDKLQMKYIKQNSDIADTDITRLIEHSLLLARRQREKTNDINTVIKPPSTSFYTIKDVNIPCPSEILEFIRRYIDKKDKLLTIEQLERNNLMLLDINQIGGNNRDKKFKRLKISNLNETYIHNSTLPNPDILICETSELNKLLNIAFMTHTIFSAGFGLPPCKTSNVMLNNRFGEMTYLMPKFYDEFVSYIDQFNNFMYRKTPIGSHLDYLSSDIAYNDVAKQMWRIISGGDHDIKDNFKDELIQKNIYEVYFTKSLVNDINTKTVSYYLKHKKLDINDMIQDIAQTKMIIYVKKDKRYVIEMLTEKQNDYKILTTSENIAHDTYIDFVKSIKKIYSINATKTQKYMTDFELLLKEYQEAMIEYIHNIHKDEIAINNYIMGNITTLPESISKKYSKQNMLIIETLKKMYQSMVQSLSTISKNYSTERESKIDIRNNINMLIQDVINMAGTSFVNVLQKDTGNIKNVTEENEYLKDIIDDAIEKELAIKGEEAAIKSEHIEDVVIEGISNIDKNMMSISKNTNNIFRNDISKLIESKYPELNDQSVNKLIDTLYRTCYKYSILYYNFFKTIEISDKKDVKTAYNIFINKINKFKNFIKSSHKSQIIIDNKSNKITSVFATQKKIIKSLDTSINIVSKKPGTKSFAYDSYINKMTTSVRHLKIVKSILINSFKITSDVLDKNMVSINNIVENNDNVWNIQTLKLNITKITENIRNDIVKLGIIMRKEKSIVNTKNGIIDTLNILNNDITTKIKGLKYHNVANVPTPTYNNLKRDDSISCVPIFIMNEDNTPYYVNDKFVQPYHYTLLLNIYSSRNIFKIKDPTELETKLLYLDIITCYVIMCMNKYHKSIIFEPLKLARNDTLNHVLKIYPSFDRSFFDLINDMFDVDKQLLINENRLQLINNHTTINSDVLDQHLKLAHYRINTVISFTERNFVINQLGIKNVNLLSFELVQYILSEFICNTEPGLRPDQRFNLELVPQFEKLLNGFTNRIKLSGYAKFPIINYLINKFNIGEIQISNTKGETNDNVIYAVEIYNRNKVSNFKWDGIGPNAYNETTMYNYFLKNVMTLIFVNKENGKATYYISPGDFDGIPNIPYVLFDKLLIGVDVDVIYTLNNKNIIKSVNFKPGDYKCIPLNKENKKIADHWNNFIVRCSKISQHEMINLKTGSDIKLEFIYIDKDDNNKEYIITCDPQNTHICPGKNVLIMYAINNNIIKLLYTEHDIIITIKNINNIRTNDIRTIDTIDIIDTIDTPDIFNVNGSNFEMYLNDKRVLSNKNYVDVYGYSEGMFRCKMKDVSQLIIVRTVHNKYTYSSMYHKDNIWCTNAHISVNVQANYSINNTSYTVAGLFENMVYSIDLDDNFRITNSGLYNGDMLINVLIYSMHMSNLILYTTVAKKIFSISTDALFHNIAKSYDKDNMQLSDIVEIKDLINNVMPYDDFPYSKIIHNIFAHSVNINHRPLNSIDLTIINNLPFEIDTGDHNINLPIIQNSIIPFKTRGNIILKIMKMSDISQTKRKNIIEYDKFNTLDRLMLHTIPYNNCLAIDTSLEYHYSRTKEELFMMINFSFSDRTIIVRFDEFINKTFGVTLADYYKMIRTDRSPNYYLHGKEEKYNIKIKKQKNIPFFTFSLKINNWNDYFLKPNLNDSKKVMKVTEIGLDKSILESNQTNDTTIVSALNAFLTTSKYYKNDASFDQYTEELDGALTKMIRNCKNIIADGFKDYLDTSYRIYPTKKNIDTFMSNILRQDNHIIMTNDTIAEIIFFILLKNVYEEIHKDLTELKLNKNTLSRDKELISIIDRCFSYPSYITINEHTNSFSIEVNSLVLWFEYFFGSFGKKMQMNLISKILKNDADIMDRHNIYQLIMGAGKSSFIAPLLSLLLCSLSIHPLHVMPESLITQSVDNMEILNNFGITTVVLNGDSIVSNTFLPEDSNKNLINYIVSSGDIKTMMIRSVKDNMYESYKKFHDTINNRFIIFDEVDDISDPFKNELNYPTNINRILDDDNEARIKLVFDLLSSLYFAKCMNISQMSKDTNEFFEKPHPYFSIKIDINTLMNILICADKDREEPLGVTLNKFIGGNFFLPISTSTIQVPIVKSIEKSIEKSTKKPIKKIDIYDYKELEILQDLNKDNIKELSPLLTNNKHKLQRLKFLQEIFSKILTTITKVNRKDFGLLYESGIIDYTKYPKISKDILERSNKIAIPFRVIDDPAITSQFSDPVLIVIYTIMGYILNKNNIIRNADIDEILNNYYTIYKSYTPQEWTVSLEKEGYDNFLSTIVDLSGHKIKLDDSTITRYNTFENIKDMLKDKKDIVFGNIKDDVLNIIIAVFRKYYSENKYQYNVSFSDTIQSDVCNRRTGFSGTPYFQVPIDRTTTKQISTDPVIDEQAEGNIFYTCLQNNVIVKKIDNVEYIFDIIKDKNYIAIIDVGALFVGWSNIIVAMRINSIRNIPVVYLDDSNKKVVYDPKYNGQYTSQHVPYNVWLTEHGFTKHPADVFIFYDQKHIVGIDFKIPLLVKALVLLNHKNGVRDFGQGAFRMRMINKGHDITIGITKTLANIIHYNDKNMSHTKYNLLNHMRLIEDKIKNSKVQLQAIQNIRAIYRQYILQNNTLGSVLGPYEYLNKNAFLQNCKVPEIESMNDYDRRYEDNVKNEIMFMVKVLNDTKSRYLMDTVSGLLSKCKFDTYVQVNDRIQLQEQEISQEQEQEQEKEIETEQEHLNAILRLEGKLINNYKIQDINILHGTIIGLNEINDDLSQQILFIKLEGLNNIYITACTLLLLIEYKKNLTTSVVEAWKLPTIKIIYVNEKYFIVSPNEYEQYIGVFKRDNIIYKPDIYNNITCVTHIMLNIMGQRSGNQVLFLRMIVSFANINDWDTLYKNADRYIKMNTISRMILEGFNYVFKKYGTIDLATIAKSIAEIDIKDMCNENFTESQVKSFIKGCILSKRSDYDHCVTIFRSVQETFKRMYANQK